MSTRDTKKRRLEAAGYVFISGWVSDGSAARMIEREVEECRPEVERIANGQSWPVGGPRKQPGKQ